MTHPLLILRHGETEWNREGRLQGALDSPLTDLGRAQAARQGRLLRDFGVTGWAWRVSPKDRAMETARIASEGLGVDLSEDLRLVEIDVGAWTGLRRDDLVEENPQFFEMMDEMLWYDHAPGGEGLIAVAKRAEQFLSDLDGPTIVVPHGITSRILRCLALGLDPMRFAERPGRQGVVYHVERGVQICLPEGT